MSPEYEIGCTRFPPPPAPGEAIERRSGEAADSSPETYNQKINCKILILFQSY